MPNRSKSINIKWAIVLLKTLVIAGIISFIMIEGVIIFSSKSEETARVDYLVILGAGLNGKQLSLALQSRVEKGLEYLKSNPDISVVVSGGQGFGEEITEAEAMKKYLVDRGIQEERIIKEEKSTSTMENFKYTKEILNHKSEELRVLIVTNDFHMFRSKLLARRNGFISYGMPSKTPRSILLNCYVREYFAVVKSLVLDR